jgi:hypothetical protein
MSTRRPPRRSRESEEWKELMVGIAAFGTIAVGFVLFLGLPDPARTAGAAAGLSAQPVAALANAGRAGADA